MIPSTQLIRRASSSDPFLSGLALFIKSGARTTKGFVLHSQMHRFGGKLLKEGVASKVKD